MPGDIGPLLDRESTQWPIHVYIQQQQSEIDNKTDTNRSEKRQREMSERNSSSNVSSSIVRSSSEQQSIGGPQQMETSVEQMATTALHLHGTNEPGVSSRTTTNASIDESGTSSGFQSGHDHGIQIPNSFTELGQHNSGETLVLPHCSIGDDQLVEWSNATKIKERKEKENKRFP